ncbi:MAG: NAD(+)/NADH kinase [Chloroflexota bacterium]|nr:NAD(+)/NADH kinase [Chloroflexota bacterium]
MSDIQCVGIYYHPRLDEARNAADELAANLRAYQVDVWTSMPWEPDRSTEHLAHTDLLICLGGDGTILRAARASAGLDCLILGVDLGRQAFLTELLPEQLDEHISDLFSGNFVVEDRAMLEARPVGVAGEAPSTLTALNDVMIGRGSLGQPAYIAVWVGEDLVGVVRADAVVVASATGSTGYSLSAGGPILHPQARNVVLTPVAPHLAQAAPMVLPGDAEIELRLGREHPGSLSVDGQRPYSLQPGGGVRVRRSESLARLIRFGERSFFAQLGKRLAWLDERRIEAVSRTGIEAFDAKNADPA